MRFPSIHAWKPDAIHWQVSIVFPLFNGDMRTITLRAGYLKWTVHPSSSAEIIDMGS